MILICQLKRQGIIDIMANPGELPPTFCITLCMPGLLGDDAAKKIALFINKSTRDYGLALWKDGKLNLQGLPPLTDIGSTADASSSPKPSYSAGDFQKLTPLGESSLLMSEEIKAALVAGGKQDMVTAHEKEFNPKGLTLQGSKAVKRTVEEVSGTNPDENAVNLGGPDKTVDGLHKMFTKLGTITAGKFKLHISKPDNKPTAWIQAVQEDFVCSPKVALGGLGPGVWLTGTKATELLKTSGRIFRN